MDYYQTWLDTVDSGKQGSKENKLCKLKQILNSSGNGWRGDSTKLDVCGSESLPGD